MVKLLEIPYAEPSTVNLTILWVKLKIIASSRDFEKINNLLELWRYDQSPIYPKFLVAILRYTYSYREHLDQWDGFINGAEYVISKHGLDPKTVLRGLL